MMTRKARALGMTRTVYVNASGLPDDEQVTTARDQSILGRAIQDRFPRYYRYFSTEAFNYHGQSIRNHNHLLGSVEGVDGIKTGYTRASGFNLVTSMRRGNRHLVGVVMGGRSGGSRDAIMRNLLAENLDKAATKRTVAAITERNPADANADVAEAEAAVAADPDHSGRGRRSGGIVRTGRSTAGAFRRTGIAIGDRRRGGGRSPPQAKPEPAPFTNGVIQTQSIAAIPGSSEPMKPVRVKTVQIKAGQIKLASAGPVAAGDARSPIQSRRRARTCRRHRAPSLPGPSPTSLPPRPKCRRSRPISAPATACSASCRHRACRLPPARRQWPMPTPAPRPQAIQQNGAIKPLAAHTGWIIQVGALESESEARERIETARSQAHGLLSKADPFTEPVVAKGDKKLFRARFAGLDRDQAEAVCRTLKRSEISCITVKN